MSSPDHPNAVLITRVFRAVEEGNVPAFWEPLADDVSASISGTGDLAGEYGEIEERDWIPCQIFAKLSLMRRGPRRKRAHIVAVFASDDRAVLSYEVSAENSDVRLPGVIVAEISNGAIVSAQHHDPLTVTGGLNGLQ
jgi:ketosteroid isomerase-like protein